MIKGRATAEGTLRFKQRYLELLDASHFRQKENLWFSSIGIGSYLGDPDANTDSSYQEALREALLGGINVVDTAINYRAQRSERCFGAELASLISTGKIRRDEIILSTKGGFLPFDGEYPQQPASFFSKTYFDSGILDPNDVVQGCHAITPKYLEDQLERSLKNLGVETVDIYFLHNPETQLSEVSHSEFLNRIRKAFLWLEEKVRQGKIAFYGTATWGGYRSKPTDPEYLSLEELHCLAREAGGAGHHFKAVQLPYNLAMPEAWIFPNQSFGANQVSFLNIALRTGLIVLGSGSLLQSRLTGPLPPFLDQHFKSLSKSAQRALQFARSAPGMTTALVGMKNRLHVVENLETAKVPLMTESEMLSIFQQDTKTAR